MVSTLFPSAPMKSPSGVWITNGLFLETASDQDRKYTLFTFKETNHEGCQSFPNLYFALTENDPTEYTFAIEVLGSWEHWQAISSSNKLKPILAKLREEKNVRQKAKAVKFMLDEVETKGKSSFQAAKLLLDKPWEDSPTTGKQRQASKTKASKEDSRVYSSFAEDAKRLGLN